MDYAFLREEGIRHLEQMVGHLWTDYNAHDPGITILEQVCYALTDLAHRINYSMPDLLYRADGMSQQDLFSAAEILPSGAVTREDLRKLVIDVPGVKNAWVVPAEGGLNRLYAQDNNLTLTDDTGTRDQVDLQGIHRVLFELVDHEQVSADTVRRGVIRRLHANRNLCEDFAEAVPLSPQLITVNARVEIEAVDDIEGLLADIYLRLAEHISPSIHFSTLRERLATGTSVDKIFDGPLLKHGFIDSAPLRRAQRRTVLRTSDMIREIMSVPGVKAVRTITIANGETPEDWSLSINDAYAVPKFNANSSTITLERNGLAANIDASRVSSLYGGRLRRAAQTRKDANTGLESARGTDRDIASYYSIQHQFPTTYGIGEGDLLPSASLQRKAQAKQLQAYLLFFDQLLANYFAQLANAKDLLSFQNVTESTYFTQAIDAPGLGLEALYAGDSDDMGWLHDLPETADTGDETARSDRRNRFLNHLLARFAEEFTDYSLLMYLSGGASASQGLAEAKQAMLKDLPELSQRRGSGFDYLQPLSEANRSGLEKRVQTKLGVTSEEERFYLVEHVLLRPLPGDANQALPFVEETFSNDPFSLQLTFVFPQGVGRYANKAFRTLVQRTITEETPAHLIPTLRWLPPEQMSTFVAAYTSWLEAHRQYALERFGVQ